MNTPNLGTARFDSKASSHTISDDVRIPERIEIGEDPGLAFELAGPRAKLFFDATTTRAGIVTCGGLCPGLNNVIRSLFLELYYGYGVKEVLGFRGGYSGLDPATNREPIGITPELFLRSIAKYRRKPIRDPDSHRSDARSTSFRNTPPAVGFWF